MTKKKHLEKLLSNLQSYKDPKVKLEQYTTPGNVASELLWSAYMRGKIKDMVIADLGSGTGILSVGSALLGAKKVYAVEIDKEAIEIAKINAERLNVEDKIIFLNKDVKDFDYKIDTTVMNPPFGCQKRNADRIFFERAFRLSDGVYSVHLAKSDVEIFLRRFSNRFDFDMRIEKVMPLSIPAQFFFHERKLERIDVSIIYFEKENKYH